MARIVYGNTLVDAQRYLLSSIPKGASVLIAGGGTGWVLEELAKIHPSGLSITYIDSSEKMIALSRKRDAGKNVVEFIAAPVETLRGKLYDAILTPFLLDNFTDDMLALVFPVLDNLLKPTGKWLYCDFQNTSRIWQKALLKTMYVFFRLSCGIKASRLPDANACFSKYGYNVLGQRKFMEGFIAATVYMRVE